VGEVKYRKVDGSVGLLRNWDEVFPACERVEKFFAALPSKFVERDDLIRKIKYAFLMREHVMITGPTGAAKSKLIDTIFDHIDGGQMWSMDLTKFTSDTHLFGNYDMAEMQKTGKLIHMLDGSIATANFAKTGEFFDASDSTLRTLLGVLNERVVKRGPQIMRIPLITALADTNFDPHELPQRSKALEAVVDRFLFRTKIDYVKDPTNRYKMLETALENDYASGLPPLYFSDIEIISGLVIEMNLIRDPYVKQAYAEMTQAYSHSLVERKLAPLSDRRFVRSAHLMEVCALLNGRTEVNFDDIKISRHILCQSTLDDELMTKCRDAALDKWMAQSQRRVVDIEVSSIKSVVDRIPTINPGVTPIRSLREASSTITALSAELSAMKPETIEAQSALVLAVGQLSEEVTKCNELILDSLMSSIPKLDTANPPASEQLGLLFAQLLRIHEEAKQVSATTDAVAKKQVAVLEAIFKARADIETALVK
jgi:MoxR-like ATPase